MTVVGLQFDKINVEKMKPASGKISVNNNVSLKDCEKTDLKFGTTKQNALKITFEFVANYEPKIATITLVGNINYFDKSEKIDEIHKEWKKDKKLPKEVLTPILNSILSKCNVEAMILSREINLPPPVPLPKVQVK